MIDSQPKGEGRIVPVRGHNNNLHKMALMPSTERGIPKKKSTGEVTGAREFCSGNSGSG